MGLPRFVHRQIDRLRRILASLEQIGTWNTIRLYGNRLLGAVLLRRIFKPLVIRADGPFRVSAGLERTVISPDADTVTFVIPTWNGMKDNLPRLLESIRAQTWPNIKIVAVDSESTDDTVAVLKSYGATVVPILKADFRHDYARNTGAEHADSKYIVFTVQDAWFTDPKWVEKGIRHLGHYGAKSFSTPQICGPEADLYARFLSYNFIAANQYEIGANVFGSRTFGRIVYALADPVFRQRLIHVDDTNHMVERSFFLKHRYSLNTCEDMEFGKKLVCAGEKFVFSTLTSITHFHAYNNHVKYFTRVFIDNLVINQLTSVRLDKVKRNGAIDCLFFFSCLLLKYLDEIFNYFESMGIDMIVFDDIRRDVLESLDENEGKKMRFSRLIDMFDRRTHDLDTAVLIVGHVQVDSPVATGLLQALDLKLADMNPVFDTHFLEMLRSRAISHMRAASDVLRRRLNVYAVPIRDYRVYTTNLVLDVAASTMAWYCGILKDETSATLPRLNKMNWV